MEDKNKKPVDKQELKKPTGKSVTGKPLDGIEIRPQLKGLGNRQHNEDTVVLTDTLAEKKALTLVQRQKRARTLRAKEPKMQRAKEVSKHKLASDEKLKARAIVQARNIVKMRFASRKGTPYAELTTAEKIQVDKVVDKKVKLIRRLAGRLLPRIRKMEYQRLASFNKGEKLQHLAPAATNEEFNRIVESLNDKSSMQLVDIIGESIDHLSENNDSMAITLKRLLNAVLPEDTTTSTLVKKAEKTGIPFSTLREVFERGLFAWDEDARVTQEQYAFSRVNSYIAKGRAWTLDADLREEKTSHDALDGAFNELVEKRGLWDNIHAKRERIKRGSGERMRKPGSKGAPTAAAFRDAAESVEDQVGNKVAPLNKHGKVSYMGIRTAAHKETGTQERGEVQYIKRNKKNIKPEKDMDPQQIRIAQDQIKKKVIDDSYKPSQLEVGTKSLVKAYQKDTPGQEKADLNEMFEIEYAAGIGVGLTANECGIFIKPGFEMHPDVVEEEKEVESDFRMIKVRTPKGWTWRKVRREANIEKDAE
jgi:hypothetical protein